MKHKGINIEHDEFNEIGGEFSTMLEKRQNALEKERRTREKAGKRTMVVTTEQKTEDLLPRPE